MSPLLQGDTEVKGIQVSVIGEALMDVIVDSAGARSAHVGGSPLNVAVGLGTLGVRTQLCTHIGDDSYGDSIRATLQMANVKVVESGLPTHSTSVATARLNTDGTADYEFDLVWALERIGVNSAQIVHTGSLATVVEPGSTVVEQAVSSAREGTLITFDPNLRPSIGLPSKLRASVERFFGLAHVVKLSDEDAHFLYPSLSLKQTAEKVIMAGASLVVITQGSQGCLVNTQLGHRQLPSVPVTVQDTVGAGDSFMAGLIFEILRTGQVNRMTQGEVDLAVAVECAKTALRCAAVTVSYAGARPPQLTELRPSD